MSWLEGEIVEFAGAEPRKRELRKIKTPSAQAWQDMYFFHVSLARAAGYPDAALAAGRRITFEPEPAAPTPRVRSFKPYEGAADLGRPARPAGPGRRDARNAGARPPSGTRPPGGGPPGAPPTRPPAGRHVPEAATHFLNPYHFIPLEPPADDALIEYCDFTKHYPLHHRFGPATGDRPVYSGRVVCRLETEGPVVVGGKQEKPAAGEDAETRVFPFELPDPDAPGAWRPAIPGSTLRGLLSSVVEAATCSALRVLGQWDRPFTRRAEMPAGEALSAIGLLREGTGGELRLLPLTCGVIRTDRPELPRVLPPEPLRVLLNGYRYDRPGKSTRTVPKTFLANRRPQSRSATHDEYWYADLSAAPPHWRERNGSWFCLGLDLPSGEEPIPETEWQALSDEDQRRFTRGILLVLGLGDGKAGELPPTKKHEYFLPFPNEREGAPALPLAPHVIEEFQELARDAAELPRGGGTTRFPFLHEGRDRPASTNALPRPGDLVYYDTDPKSRAVSRISYSALWRRFVPGGSLRDRIGRVSKDLLPFHAGRDQLTAAERLFGVVEANGKRALAGRLRVAHAVATGDEPAEGWYGEEIPLQILNSPKPPSPALYFGHEGHLSKHQLHLGHHRPPGRKVYLHHRKEDVDAESYRARPSEDDAKRKLRLKVRPLATGTSFLFHIDFWNLSADELGALVYALRPTGAFRHKLGLGKPLGLGRVRIDPLLVGWIDRHAVYEAARFWGPKYAAVEPLASPESWAELSPALAARYRHERSAAAAPPRGAPTGWPTFADLRSATQERIPLGVRSAIERFGDPAEVHLPVTYPVCDDQAGEGEHFQWFVANDKDRHREYLGPLEPGKPLPYLKRLPRPQRGN